LIAEPTRQLSLFDAVCIIVGIVIGAGIYETAPVIAEALGTPDRILLFWLLGGFLSLIGALCYAEISSTCPEAGGDYAFLNRAYGKRIGFLFAWSSFWVVRPANIGAVAYIFAHYAADILPLYRGSRDLTISAVAAVLILSAVNLLGVQSGKWTQNVLTVLKVVGLLLIIAFGLCIATPTPVEVAVDQRAAGSNYYLALILVLFTYGGWNNIAYVAVEVRRPTENILRSLVLGVSLITLLYIFINLAFLKVLGLPGMVASDSVASDMLRVMGGTGMALFISVLICVTCLGSINGMLLTESRIYYALGREYRVLDFLGRWHPRLDTPVWSLTLQAAICLAMIILLGGNAAAFERLVVLSAPLFWFFVLLVSLSLFQFRRRQSQSAGVYRVPCYPWLPLLFVASNLFILYASLAYAWQQRYVEIFWVAIVLISGLLASLFRTREYRMNK
jgi:amino acid transporter